MKSFQLIMGRAIMSRGIIGLGIMGLTAVAVLTGPGMTHVLASAQPAASALGADPVAATNPAVTGEWQGPRFVTDDAGVALQGYDPVAYFTEKAPRSGSAQFQTDYEGATFQFASEENRDQFVNDPEAFAPQFGGYCVKNLAQGSLVPGSPLEWTIVGNRLYFLGERKALEQFNRAREDHLTRAADQWSELDRLARQRGF